MLIHSVSPQIADTDVLGHINFLAVPRWFDHARTELYQELAPTLDPCELQLVILKTEVQYESEIRLGDLLEVRTSVRHIGNKSVHIYQEIWKTGSSVSFYQQKKKNVSDNQKSKSDNRVITKGTVCSEIENSSESTSIFSIEDPRLKHRNLEWPIVFQTSDSQMSDSQKPFVSQRKAFGTVVLCGYDLTLKTSRLLTSIERSIFEQYLDERSPD